MIALSTKELKMKSGKIFPAGTRFFVTVNKEKPTQAILSTRGEEKDIAMPSVNLWKFFEEFDEVTEAAIAEAMADGKCPSLTGEDVEPDGWDPQGFPSMLMASGLV